MFIAIDLAPGAGSAKRAKRKLPTLTLPSLGSAGQQAKNLSFGLLGLAVLGAAGYGYQGMRRSATELQTRIDLAVADSSRYAAVIALFSSLEARQDTITRKIEVIRGVDTRRYVWPHLLDEISLAVPAYTWLTTINSTEPADSAATGPVFTIEGNTGSTQALTRFMKNLEASPFVGEVTLITTAQEDVSGRAIQKFSIEATYRAPDPGLLENYPLLALE